VTAGFWALVGVFQDLMDGLIAEAASRGQADLSLASVDSAVGRAHQDTAGLALFGEVLDALEVALPREKTGSAGAIRDFRYRVVRTARASLI